MITGILKDLAAYKDFAPPRPVPDFVAGLLQTVIGPPNPGPTDYRQSLINCMTDDDALTDQFTKLMETYDTGDQDAYLSALTDTVPLTLTALEACDVLPWVPKAVNQIKDYWTDLTSKDNYEQILLNNYNSLDWIVDGYGAQMTAAWFGELHYNSGQVFALGAEIVLGFPGPVKKEDFSLY